MKCLTPTCQYRAVYDGYCPYCSGTKWKTCSEKPCDQMTQHQSGRCFMHRSAELLSIKHAAVMLGVSEKTMQRLADSGEIPAQITAGKHRRFKLDDIKKFIEGQSAKMFARLNTDA